MDFSDLATDSIWKLIGVILHLGNLEFDVKEDNGESIATIANKKDIDTIANLLQVDPKDLEQALLTRVIAAMGEVGVVNSSFFRYLRRVSLSGTIFLTASKIQSS